MKKKHHLPREGSIMLYRGLVKDQLNDSRDNTMIRKQTFSCERERMRVLEILSLLPNSKQTDPDHSNHGGGSSKDQQQRQQKKKKIPNLKHPCKNNAGYNSSANACSSTSIPGSVHSSVSSGSSLGPSPYKSTKTKSRRAKLRKAGSDKSKIYSKSKKEKSVRLLPRDDDYLWHPVTVEKKHGGEKKVVQDVMKYYSSQYHHTGHKSKKKK